MCLVIFFFLLTFDPSAPALQLLNLCEAEDAALMKLPCYKSLPSLVPLRIAALSKFGPSGSALWDSHALKVLAVMLMNKLHPTPS